jgi:hypothetical protein
MKVSDTGGGDFEQCPPGTHIARCFRIIDLGTQAGEYQGIPNHKRQIVIGWELPDILMSKDDNAGKPFIVSKFYTASLSEKATLRKDLVNWRGREFTHEELKGFEMKNILNATCMLSITHNDKQKARVTGVMALPKGVQANNLSNKASIFSLDEFSQSEFDNLPKKFKAMIEISPEYQALIHGTPMPVPAMDNFNAFDDDIPF